MASGTERAASLASTFRGVAN